MRACWNLKSTFDFGRTRNGAPSEDNIAPIERGLQIEPWRLLKDN
jgi:hypothetical protein